MTAYEEVGKPFSRLVEYIDDKTGIRYVFPVPDEFVGVKNGLLVVEHPDFTLEADGNSRIVRAARVELIEKFPAAYDRWYLTDPKHGIPFGEIVNSSNANARWLWRIAKSVGLVARDYVDLSGRLVDLDGRPSALFGVACESRVLGCEASGKLAPSRRMVSGQSSVQVK